MKPFKILILLLLMFRISFSQDEVAMLDNLFNTMHDRSQFSGNVLVVAQGEVIYDKSFGLADRGTERELNIQTLFNTGSVSKTLTAVAILQLAEKGLLNVDEPVKKYLPDFPFERITIGHLLTHASGLPAKSTVLENLVANKIASNTDVIDYLYNEKLELEFTPGSNSIFNDVGYIVLAVIVEKISKEEFNQYLKKNIFETAGMTRTGIYNADQIKDIDNAAKGYLFSPYSQKYEEAVAYPTIGNLYQQSGTMGDDNLWSTTGDLLNFCKAIANNTLLNEEMVIEMFLKKTEAKMPGQTRSYGNSFSYGWTIPEAPYRIANARGDMPGFNSSIVWNLSENRMMIYLSNDYLSFTSYNNILPYAIGTVVNQGVLNIPKKYASVELTNVVLHISEDQIKDKIIELKSNTEEYDFDVAGLQYLVTRLKDMAESEKANLIESMLYD